MKLGSSFKGPMIPSVMSLNGKVLERKCWTWSGHDDSKNETDFLNSTRDSIIRKLIEEAIMFTLRDIKNIHCHPIRFISFPYKPKQIHLIIAHTIHTCTIPVHVSVSMLSRPELIYSLFPFIFVRAWSLEIDAGQGRNRNNRTFPTTHYQEQIKSRSSNKDSSNWSLEYEAINYIHMYMAYSLS